VQTSYKVRVTMLCSEVWIQTIRSKTPSLKDLYVNQVSLVCTMVFGFLTTMLPVYQPSKKNS
jgi:hypothetical protein